MPNWCRNDLVITGPAHDMELFHKAVSSLRTSSEGILSAFVFSEQNEDWYPNNCEAWGTKWDVPWDAVEELSELDRIEDESTWILRFDTAWSPPVPWVCRVAARFPLLTFELSFVEFGMCFHGVCVARNQQDVVIENEMPEYPESEGSEDAWSDENQDWISLCEEKLENMIGEAHERMSIYEEMM